MDDAIFWSFRLDEFEHRWNDDGEDSLEWDAEGWVGGDIERARGVAHRVRTGTMSVNGGIFFSPDMPFGGYKQSGIGREMGVAGFEEYLEIKSIAEGV